MLFPARACSRAPLGARARACWPRTWRSHRSSSQWYVRACACACARVRRAVCSAALRCTRRPCSHPLPLRHSGCYSCCWPGCPQPARRAHARRPAASHTSVMRPEGRCTHAAAPCMSHARWPRAALPRCVAAARATYGRAALMLSPATVAAQATRMLRHAGGVATGHAEAQRAAALLPVVAGAERALGAMREVAMEAFAQYCALGGLLRQQQGLQGQPQVEDEAEGVSVTEVQGQTPAPPLVPLLPIMADATAVVRLAAISEVGTPSGASVTSPAALATIAAGAADVALPPPQQPCAPTPSARSGLFSPISPRSTPRPPTWSRPLRSPRAAAPPAAAERRLVSARGGRPRASVTPAPPAPPAAGGHPAFDVRRTRSSVQPTQRPVLGGDAVGVLAPPRTMQPWRSSSRRIRSGRSSDASGSGSFSGRVGNVTRSPSACLPAVAWRAFCRDSGLASATPAPALDAVLRAAAAAAWGDTNTAAPRTGAPQADAAAFLTALSLLVELGVAGREWWAQRSGGRLARSLRAVLAVPLHRRVAYVTCDHGQPNASRMGASPPLPLPQHASRALTAALCTPRRPQSKPLRWREAGWWPCSACINRCICACLTPAPPATCSPPRRPASRWRTWRRQRCSAQRRRGPVRHAPHAARSPALARDTPPPLLPLPPRRPA